MSEDQTEKQKTADWEETLSRLGLSDVDITQVRPEDILYLADQWQFLQVVELSGEKAAYENPRIIQLNSGWDLIDYGNAMATSPGKYMFGSGRFRSRNDDDDDGGESGGGGHGTIVKQSFDSACELIQLAQNNNWKGVLIIDGHPNMQRAAWMEAVKIGVRLDGYTADVAAEKTRRRIGWTAADIEVVKQKMSAGMKR